MGIFLAKTYLNSISIFLVLYLKFNSKLLSVFSFYQYSNHVSTVFCVSLVVLCCWVISVMLTSQLTLWYNSFALLVGLFANEVFIYVTSCHLTVWIFAGLMFENSCEIGVFSKLTNAYCLVAIGGSENFYRFIPVLYYLKFSFTGEHF